ncbi:MAG: GAF domain-containing sensor histidine kinase [Candidatus Omnitrophica bacterium]|nr:GAF domain-containing sensor histidine kinase [Candidatus Omnitrophota bacterium]
MENLEFLFSSGVSLFFFLISLTIIIFLSIFSLKKMDRIRILGKEIRRLENSLREMDEQAKLIVKTDLELSKVQEELDKRVSGLLALQRLSQSLSSTLEEESLFLAIREDLISDLGFSSCLIIVKKGDSLAVPVSIGVNDEFKEMIASQGGAGFFRFLISKEVISHKELPPEFEYLFQKSSFKSFLASSIQSKDSPLGFLILGNIFQEEISGGALEIVEIFSSQLAQSLENIHLFEEVFRSHRELEEKVKERTKSLQEALEKIEKISRLKSEFVSAVSHEFRTPLTSIKGYASLLVQERFGKIPPAVRLRLERINQQADTLVNMINELLDIARIESGRSKIEIQKIDLSETMKKIADYFYPQLKEKNLQLILTLSSLFVEADKSLLERVFINLLSNAIKFTPQGKKIEIKCEKKDNYAEVSVRDEGIGIPQEDLENIFKEFYRIDNPLQKEVKGTGLGLSLVRNIIKAHQGEIWVESKVGEGSKFIFTLPLAQESKI